MIRFLINILFIVLGNALGLIAASLLLAGFGLSMQGFVTSVIVFTVAQGLLSPFVLKMAIKYAPAFRGGIALITVLVALLVTVLLTHGIQLADLTTWLLAPLVIWISTVIAGIVLPMLLFKKVFGRVSTKTDRNIRNII